MFPENNSLTPSSARNGMLICTKDKQKASLESLYDNKYYLPQRYRKNWQYQTKSKDINVLATSYRKKIGTWKACFVFDKT